MPSRMYQMVGWQRFTKFAIDPGPEIDVELIRVDAMVYSQENMEKDYATRDSEVPA